MCSSDVFSLPVAREASRCVVESVGFSAGVKSVSNSSVWAISCSTALSADLRSSQQSSTANFISS